MSPQRMMIWMTLAVVLTMAAGQLLFKATARALVEHGSVWELAVLWRFAVAIAIYGFATLAWIWVLRTASLSAAYPIIALTFILVPLGAHVFFSEPIGARYWLGSTLIFLGIVVSTSSALSRS